MAPYRKQSLEERQAEMRKRQLAERRKIDKRCKIDPQRVMELAAMNFRVREIAAELGCSEDALYTDYREVIEEGRERGGIALRKVIHKMALGGDPVALRHLHRALNEEDLAIRFEIPKRPKPLKPWHSRPATRKIRGHY